MYLPVDWPAPDLVALAAGRVPDRTALADVDGAGSWSYRELTTGPVAAASAGLREAGVGPADHLGVIVEPAPAVAHLLHASARVGARFVPLPPDSPVDPLRRRVEVASVDHIVSDAAGLEVARAAFDGPVADVEAVLATAVGGDDGEPHRWAPDDVRWLVFTSGTTGEPLPVALTTRNLVASATGSALRLGVDADDRWLACLPTHHVGGLAPFVRSALYGTTVVVQSSFDEAATARVLAERDVTAISLVPTMLRRLLDVGWTSPEHLRFVLLGGAPAPAALLERATEAGVPVCPTYGMTETASQVATARPAEVRAHPGTVGRPLLGTTVEVVDDEGQPMPAGDPGTLVVSGPTVAAGYHDRPEATAERFVEGRFHTRDVGRRNGDGRLWILGRLDDAIATGGETVHPGPVREALLAHRSVDDAAVVGLPDPDWGEVVAALVVPSADHPHDGPLDLDALDDHCRSRLDPHAVPKVLAVADRLPRTTSGTVDRASVRERLTMTRGREGL